MEKEKEEQESKNTGKKIIVILLLILIILGAVFAIYKMQETKVTKDHEKEIFESLEITEVDLTEYVVYGTHLNIKGELKEILPNVKGVSLVLAGVSGERKNIKVDYEIAPDKISFSTSSLINEGIDLESLNIDKHYILLEVSYGEKNEKKNYSIKNGTEYANVEYYTITRNGSNNKIDIGFDIYTMEEHSTNYMALNVSKTKLPKDVYDVVIDPGHGGSDIGAENRQI